MRLIYLDKAVVVQGHKRATVNAMVVGSIFIRGVKLLARPNFETLRINWRSSTTPLVLLLKHKKKTFLYIKTKTTTT